jgi:two-component system, OmpR family, sensor histidine kinase MtrB
MTIRRHRRGPSVNLVPSPLRSLRARLVIAFVLVALLSGAAATAATYREARDSVVNAAQDPAMVKTRELVNERVRPLRTPLTQTALNGLVEQVPGEAEDPATGQPRRSVRVAYENLEAPAGTAWPPIPRGLRTAVHETNRMMYQRFTLGSTVYLAYGIPVFNTENRPSGLEVYVLADLNAAQRSAENLAWSSARFTGLTLIIAVLLALLAAQGVLRPVHELRDAAQQIAGGKLDTRLRERGADELSELVRTFNHTAEELEYNVDALRQMEANARRFVADVSHELRTPLAAMAAVTDTLDEEADDLTADAATAARLVSTETRKLAQLVENLIEITRFDAGRAELRLDGDVDLASVVTATLAARGWTDRVETILAPGVFAEVDRRRVDVILANLIGNALRHGGRPVTVRLLPDTAPYREDGYEEWVTVEVADHGPGLPPDIMARVFDRFFKADSARSRSEGSGLGLAIAMENAKLHAGTISVHNAKGGGAVFGLRLPRWQPAGPPG